MIRRELKSQLIELEKRYAPVVQAKRDKESAPARGAHFHALQVAAVALYGEPKMEEPLRVAYSRMKEKLGEELFAAAMDEWWSALLRDALRRADDNLKFERIFSKAPVWLLKFTGIEWDAKLLGFKLRKLVGAPALGWEARRDRNRWPFLPEGTIDAGGECSDPDEPWERIIERRCHELWNPRQSNALRR